MAQMDWYYQPVPGLEACLTAKTKVPRLPAALIGGFAFYVAGLYRTTPPNGTEPKIDLALRWRSFYASSYVPCCQQSRAEPSLEHSWV